MTTEPEGPERTNPPTLSPTTPDYNQKINIKCYRGGTQSRINSSVLEKARSGIARLQPLVQLSDSSLNLPRPSVMFDIESREADSSLQLVFRVLFGDEMLVYYPSSLDTSDLSEQNVDENINCQIVSSMRVLIKDLIPSTVYTFCAFVSNDLYAEFQTPFQCKSFLTPTPFARQTWIYQGQKIIIMTSFLTLLLLSLIVGIAVTYLIIRRMPTLLKGSKRVVMVNNRTKDVIVLPSGSRNNSCQKESVTAVGAEAPIYLTPRPRESFDHGNG